VEGAKSAKDFIKGNKGAENFSGNNKQAKDRTLNITSILCFFIYKNRLFP
jgi:hypothetical protein